MIWSLEVTETNREWGAFLAPYGLVVVDVLDEGRQIYVGLPPKGLYRPASARLSPETLHRADEAVIAKIERKLRLMEEDTRTPALQARSSAELEARVDDWVRNG